ncbi:hypothetical protein NIES2100_11280 [Calothrix sp. NIES-2100]|uniref:hypothetical protein n=1 Tax=Calothrix sp. NIES-2100 TaxID=1954172 RepID=UPI000B5F7EE2|nr:hypothetical protein NIES2100_11280 [Calothrix sp. NIES-2100]
MDTAISRLVIPIIMQTETKNQAAEIEVSSDFREMPDVYKQNGRGKWKFSTPANSNIT